MKFNYQFSNLLGTVYRKGTLIFTPDGGSVLSPVGNKISVYDLQNHKSRTLSIEARHDFTSLALKDSILLAAATENGDLHLISLISDNILHTLRTDSEIRDIAFSPDGTRFAFTKRSEVFIYKTPGLHGAREFNPFTLERVLKGAYDDVTCISWSSCSRVIAVGSIDNTTRIYVSRSEDDSKRRKGSDRFTNFSVHCLGGSIEPVIATFFEQDSLFCYTVHRNGHLSIWQNSHEVEDFPARPKRKNREKKKPENESDMEEDDITSDQDISEKTEKERVDSDQEEKFYYKRAARHFLKDQLKKGNKNAELTAADYHSKAKIFVAGFSNGCFFIYDLPDVNLIHSLAISDHEITTLRINSTGDWIAFGCAHHGQLLVWEWKSESYVLKQQGHYNNMASLTYNHDGSVIATGGQDGKVKLWSTTSGFCYVTFDEHTSAVTGVTFSPNDKVLVSASLDGSVRAFDMSRYRNFRTFTSPRPVQFSCVALDSSGELVVAGGHDVFELYLWSLKTGKLLEVISGHEAPVSSVAFSPSVVSSTLVSVSWDKTMRIWDSVNVGSGSESIQLGSDGICVAFRPDGQQVAVSTINGQISFFDIQSANQAGTIDGRTDLGSGRSDTDAITAQTATKSKYFDSIRYSADGSCILAAGRSKNVCIYHVTERLLVKKFEITQNRSLDAMDDIISRKKLTEFGNLGLVEDRGDDAIALPGTRKEDRSSRSVKPEVRVTGVQFSPTGREFSVTSTEGLLIYSLDHDLIFDPVDLTIDITPASIRSSVRSGNNSEAVMMALKLNESRVIRYTIEATPVADVDLLCRNLPEKYVGKILKFVGSELESTSHLQFYATWAKCLLVHHGSSIKRDYKSLLPVLNCLQKNLMLKSKDLGDICNHNLHMMRYLLALSKIKKEMAKKKSEESRPMDEVEEESEADELIVNDDDDNEFMSNWDE